MLFLVNGFSTGMLGPGSERWGHRAELEFRTLRPCEAGELLRQNRFVSRFGHSETAWHLSRYLHVRIPVSREPICPGPGDEVLVASAKHTRAYREGYIGCPRWVFFLVRWKGEAFSVKSGE